MEKTSSRSWYAVACELHCGGEIVLWGWRLPVFTKCVVIHALGFHVWVKVFLFFDCSQYGEKISVTSPRDGCQWRSLCVPWLLTLSEERVPDSLCSMQALEVIAKCLNINLDLCPLQKCYIVHCIGLYVVAKNQTNAWPGEMRGCWNCEW